jgi:hypothetical protein
MRTDKVLVYIRGVKNVVEIYAIVTTQNYVSRQVTTWLKR